MCAEEAALRQCDVSTLLEILGQRVGVPANRSRFKSVSTLLEILGGERRQNQPRPRRDGFNPS